MTAPRSVQAEAYCRVSGIQVETTTDTGGGLNAGYMDTGVRLEYDIEVPAA